MHPVLEICRPPTPAVGSGGPPLVAAEHLHQLFASCGTILSISVSKGSGKDYESRFAHVVFKSTKGVAAALAMPTPSDFVPLTKELGLAKWMAQSQTTHKGDIELQQDVDSFITKFERQEADKRLIISNWPCYTIEG